MKFPLVIQQQLSDHTVSMVIQVNLSEEFITLKQLIALKVTAQIEKKTAQINQELNSKEKRLNQTKAKQDIHYDIESEINKALEQFMKNGFFVLIDGKQIQQLNEIIQWHQEMEVVFLQLIPLAGG